MTTLFLNLGHELKSQLRPEILFLFTFLSPDFNTCLIGLMVVSLVPNYY